MKNFTLIFLATLFPCAGCISVTGWQSAKKNTVKFPVRKVYRIVTTPNKKRKFIEVQAQKKRKHFFEITATSDSILVKDTKYPGQYDLWKVNGNAVEVIEKVDTTNLKQEGQVLGLFRITSEGKASHIGLKNSTNSPTEHLRSGYLYVAVKDLEGEKWLCKLPPVKVNYSRSELFKYLILIVTVPFDIAILPWNIVWALFIWGDNEGF